LGSTIYPASLKRLGYSWPLDVSEKDGDGWIALHLAAQDGHEAVVKLLAEAEAGVNGGGSLYSLNSALATTTK
jgi:ankyrin repeat protein